ncbi:hypothetical protein VKT23_004204 [Stygiomarasmius scandens]|uniref:Uncharacterized protein n=1 Tax=Marasmiellus scandens TaxID=2682957 RepID=A0ABR1JUA4_9AGAR
MTPPPPSTSSSAVSFIPPPPSTFTSTFMPPPPSTSSTTIFTLPPVPNPPAVLTTRPKTPVTRAEPSKEEKEQALKRRIELLEKHLTTRTEYTKVDEQIKDIELLTNSSSFPSSSSSTRQKTESKLASLKTKRSELKEKMNSVVNQLVESDCWPVGSWSGSSSGPGSMSREENERREKEVLELVDLVNKLDKNVKEVHELTKEMLEEREKDEDRRDEEDGMDIDNPSGTPRPPKRRRLSSGVEEPLPPSPDQVKELQDALAHIEDFLVSVQNNLTAGEEETREILRHYLDQREEEWNNDTTLALASSDISIEQVEKMQKDVDELGPEVKEVADEVAELIKKVAWNEKKIEELEAEDTKIVEEIQELKERIAKQEELQKSDQREVAALSAALKAYMDTPLSPPASPFDPDSVLPLIEEPVKEIIRDVIKSRLTEHRKALQADLEERDKEMYESVWNKLTITHTMLKSVAKRVGTDPAS